MNLSIPIPVNESKWLYQTASGGGLTIALVAGGDRYRNILVVLQEFLELMMRIIGWIMRLAPLGILGAVLANTFRGMERDVYFQVAMLTTVGLTSKNAILIVEFAKEHLEKGAGLIEATMHAVRDRLRPIIMTSLAFGLGVLPLAIASGAGGRYPSALCGRTRL